MCYQGLKHQQQFPLGRGDMGHQLSSPNPLKELRHQRVAKERPIAKPLLTVRNGCCIHLTGGVRQTPFHAPTLKLQPLCPVVVCATRTDGPACLNLSGARPEEAGPEWATWLLPPFLGQSPQFFFFTVLWNIKIAVDRIKNTNISSLDLKVPC